MSDNISRKEFLQRLSLLGAGAIGAGSLLTYCGGEKKAEPKETETTVAEPEDPCGDLSALTEEEKQLRTNFKYVAKSDVEDQYCDNCSFWIKPEGDNFCGGCTVIKGPIHPKGHCITWAEIQQQPS